MRMQLRRWALILVLCGAVPIITSAASCQPADAVIDANPTIEAQQAVRDAGSQIVANVNSGVEITRAGWRTIQALPIEDATKISIGEKILVVTGSTDDPGPLPAILVALESATSDASLAATAQTAMDLFEPLVAELEASDNTTVRFLAVAIRSAMLYTTTYVAQVTAAGGN